MAGLYTAFASGLLFPLHEWMKGHTSLSVRVAMEESQWWSRDQLSALQLVRLRHLLDQAYHEVPYYRRIMDERGITPNDIDSLGAISKLPFLSKVEIRVNGDDLRARNASTLSRFTTGGSSGEPLTFLVGKERVSHDVAAKWRATRWWNLDIGDPEIVIWGSPIEVTGQDRAKMWRDWVLRTRLIPAFEMSPSNLDRFVAEIRSFRPRMLFGYPTALSLIARHARRTGQSLGDIGIRTAFVTSERLYDDQRMEIASTYNCSVANGYGGRDSGFIAHECPHGSMHVTAEDILVEIVDNNGTPQEYGIEGEIVVTHFGTGDFPFIRYRTGDVGVLSEANCPCGRSLPVIRKLQGRTTDFVVAKNGTVMHGLALIYVLRDLPGIDRFKIIQESVDWIRVLVEPGSEWSDNSPAEIISGFKRRLGQDVEVSIELVDRMPVDPSGKFRFLVSKVQ